MGELTILDSRALERKGPSQVAPRRPEYLHSQGKGAENMSRQESTLGGVASHSS